MPRIPGKVVSDPTAALLSREAASLRFGFDVTPLEPVTRGRKVALGLGFFALFVVAWSVVTFGGFVPKTFLADPLAMLREGWALFTQFGFAKDVGITIWRVFGGFILAALIGVPLGIAMGAYKPIEAFFEPFVSFARYLPASAFIPLLILWAGCRSSSSSSSARSSRSC